MSQGQYPPDPTDHGAMAGLSDQDHPASAITFSPSGLAIVTGTDVQAAIEQLDSATYKVLGYAEVTSDQTGITTEVDLTGLTDTVDVASSRRIKVTAHVMTESVGGETTPVLSIKQDGTTIAVAQVGRWGTGGTRRHTIVRQVVVTPSAGSHTFKLTLSDGLSAGLTMKAASDNPASILIEDIGPA